MTCRHHERYKTTIKEHTAMTTFPPGWHILMTVKFGHFKACEQCREWAIQEYKLDREEVEVVLEAEEEEKDL